MISTNENGLLVLTSTTNVTLEQSKATLCVNKYFESIRFTTRPAFTVDTLPNGKFISTLDFPQEFDTAPRITGTEQMSKKLAKGSVAIFACQWLYDQQLLNDHFQHNPVHTHHPKQRTKEEQAKAAQKKWKQLRKALTVESFQRIGCHWLYREDLSEAEEDDEERDEEREEKAVDEEILPTATLVMDSAADSGGMALYSASGTKLDIHDGLGYLHHYCQSVRNMKLVKLTVETLPNGKYVGYAELPEELNAVQLVGPEQNTQKYAKGAVALVGVKWLYDHQLINDNFHTKHRCRKNNVGKFKPNLKPVLVAPDEYQDLVEVSEYFYRVEGTGAIISLDTSIDLLHDFCQTLLHAHLRPRYYYEEHSDRPRYSCRLELPDMLDIKPIQGPRLSNKIKAKKTVSVLGCRAVYTKKLMDANLRSLYQAMEETKDGELVALTDNPNPKKNKSADAIEPESDNSTVKMCTVPPPDAELLDLEPVEFDEEQEKCTFHVYSLKSKTHSYKLGLMTKTAIPLTEFNVMKSIDAWDDDQVVEMTIDAHTEISLSFQEFGPLIEYYIRLSHMIFFGAYRTLKNIIAEIDAIAPGVEYDANHPALISFKNNKGYLLVPLSAQDNDELKIDWNHLEMVLGRPFTRTIWPDPFVNNPEQISDLFEDAIIVVRYRHFNLYKVRGMTDTTIAEALKVREGDGRDTRTYWQTIVKDRIEDPTTPILGQFYHYKMLDEADQTQKLVHVSQMHHHLTKYRRSMDPKEGSKSLNKERLLLPEFCEKLQFPASIHSEAIEIFPMMNQFEGYCQCRRLRRVVYESMCASAPEYGDICPELHQIMQQIDLSAIYEATQKPDYERLEIFGDAFLKFETTWYFYVHAEKTTPEGDLCNFRESLIRNDHLLSLAIQKKLFLYFRCPAMMKTAPNQYWLPSGVQAIEHTPILVRGKSISDTIEALIGAYVASGGEMAGREFMRFIGIPCLDRSIRSSPFPSHLKKSVPTLTHSWTDAFTNLLEDKTMEHDELLQSLQDKLGYQFSNVNLLIEALTHASAGNPTIEPHPDEGSSRTTPSEASSSSSTTIPSYERLEFLGDAVLEYVAMGCVFEKHPEYIQGQLSRWKHMCVSNMVLSQTGILFFEIHEVIRHGSKSYAKKIKAARKWKQSVKHSSHWHDLHPDQMRQLMHELEEMEAQESEEEVMSPATSTSVILEADVRRKQEHSQQFPKLFADVFEALIGAVFLDCQYNLAIIRDSFLAPIQTMVGPQIERLASDYAISKPDLTFV